MKKSLEIKQIRGLVKDIDPEVGILDMEGELLYRLAQKTAGHIVEIGSWKGRSTIWLAKGVPGRSKVFAVDPHIGTVTHAFEKGGSTYPEFRANIDRAGAANKVVAMVMDSRQAAGLIHLPVGMVFIDGDHSYEAAKFDVEVWGDKLLPGGIIALHDTIGYEGVRRVTEKDIFGGGYRIIGIKGQIVAARKMDGDMPTSSGFATLLNNLAWFVYWQFYSLAFRLAKELPEGTKRWLKNL